MLRIENRFAMMMFDAICRITMNPICRMTIMKCCRRNENWRRGGDYITILGMEKRLEKRGFVLIGRVVQNKSG